MLRHYAFFYPFRKCAIMWIVLVRTKYSPNRFRAEGQRDRQRDIKAKRGESPSSVDSLWILCLLATKPQRHQGDQMLFPLPLITSCYGLALFGCPLVNKPSCLPVLIQGISPSPKCAPRAGRTVLYISVGGIISNIHIKLSRRDSHPFL